MNRLEKILSAKIGESWRGATPSLQVQVHQKGKKRIDLRYGPVYAYYDWASLTKIVFSSTLLMRAFDEKRFQLNDPITKFVPWFESGAPAGARRMRDLLSHSAGLEWWQPLYKDLKTEGQRKLNPERQWQTLRGVLEQKMHAYAKTPATLATNGKVKSVYSDLDLFVLGYAIEAMFETTLQELASEWIAQQGLKDTFFHFGNQPMHADRKQYAPTEVEAFHGQTRPGEVHDENTWALGGVSPHAGLFGPLEDLSQWGLWLRKSYLGTTTRGLPSAHAVKTFTTRAIPRAQGDWALLYMMPTKGSASCGALFSSKSVGHTGFTGTSLWFDPKADCLVTVLSNRVHPSRANEAFRAFRPQLHTWIAQTLRDS